GKVRESQRIFAAALPQAEVLCVADLPSALRNNYVAEESGQTYAQNALIKAHALARLVDGLILADAKTASVPATALIHPWILAEDSGFEVDALGGAPGVYSARYAADDKTRCAKILDSIRGLPAARRTARFIACVALVECGKNPVYFLGRKEGFVAEAARGNAGFGYDPIFLPELGGATWAETGAEVKNADSHRSRALDLVIQYLAGVVAGVPSGLQSARQPPH
ncbi:MAG: non-canonical purine NTP pyrophosphatase, partial [Spirochaetes bacterium]|nr:non-canonical purine NTP pyrophosphatase [Spirochaetota bacterium]